MFEVIENREYRIGGKTIIFESVVDGKKKFRLSEYTADLSISELEKTGNAILAFVAEKAICEKTTCELEPLLKS